MDGFFLGSRVWVEPAPHFAAAPRSGVTVVAPAHAKTSRTSLLQRPMVVGLKRRGTRVHNRTAATDNFVVRRGLRERPIARDGRQQAARLCALHPPAANAVREAMRLGRNGAKMFVRTSHVNCAEPVMANAWSKFVQSAERRQCLRLRASSPVKGTFRLQPSSKTCDGELPVYQRRLGARSPLGELIRFRSSGG